MIIKQKKTILRIYTVSLLLLVAFSVFGVSAKAQNENADPPTVVKPKLPKQNVKNQGANKKSDGKNQKVANQSKPSKNSVQPPKPNKPTTANLALTVNESGSNVEINRFEKGNTVYVESADSGASGDALQFESLRPGDYLIKIRKNGFYEQQLKVTLRAGKTADLTATLKPSVGFLVVASDADDAEIEIKNFGKYAGEIKNLALVPQQYEISISAEGYEPVVRAVDIKAGQTAYVEGSLKLSAPEKLLQVAERDFQNNLYKETISSCRLILEQNPDEPRANLLMGYAYFYSSRPREAHFYLARALALQTDVELPIKIYRKEKNSEILTDGTLKINRNNFSFSAGSETNFNLSPASIEKIEIIQDKNNAKSSLGKPDSIQIKASVANGKKTEKKTLRLFPRRAFARAIAAGKAEIAACADCQSGGECLCQTEIRAVFELLLNWKSGSYPRTRTPVSVAPPSNRLTRYDGKNFSAGVPENWAKVSEANNSIWFAPEGGFFSRQNRTQFRIAINFNTVPISNNDLRLESEKFYQTILAANRYLEQKSTIKEISIFGRKALAASFVGFNAEDQEEELVQIYTTFTKDGNLFYLLTVTPFEQRRQYKQTFNLTLNSINLQ